MTEFNLTEMAKITQFPEFLTKLPEETIFTVSFMFYGHPAGLSLRTVARIMDIYQVISDLMTTGHIYQ